MAVLDRPIGRLALNLIRKFGKPVTLVRYGKPTYDPVTRMTASGPPTETTVRGVFTRVSNSMIDGTVIKRRDEALMIAAKEILGVEPTTDDRIKDGSRDLQIVFVDEIRSGEETAVWALVVRR